MIKNLLNILIIAFINIFAIFIITFSISLIYLYQIKNKETKMPDYLKQLKPLTSLYKNFFLGKNEKKLVKIMEKYDPEIIKAIINKDNRWYMNYKLYDYYFMYIEERYWHKSNMIKFSFRFPISTFNNDTDYVLNIHTVYNETYKSEIDQLAKEILTDYQFNTYYLSTLVNFNENGCRKTGINNKKKLPVILFVGDSFTEGLYMNDDKTFVHYSGEKFYNNDFGYSVNGGVNGYSVFEIPFILENIALEKINPKIIVFTHSPGDLTKSDEDTDSLLNGTIDAVKKDKLWTKDFYWLNKINDFCKKNNIIFIINLYPDCSQIINYGEWGYSNANFQDIIKKFCSENRILCIDFFNEMESAVFNEINKRLNIVINKSNQAETFKQYHPWYDLLQNSIYIIEDGHLSEKGHKLFGDLISTGILKNYKRINDHYEINRKI